MKIYIATAFLLSSASAFVGQHHNSRSSKTFGSASPLALLPKNQQQSDFAFSAPAKDSDFYPFESTALYANKEVDDGSAGVRQLLGVRGASEETDIWKIRLQLTKPVTWIPLLWGVMCGAAASGNYHWIWNPFDPNDRNVLLGFEDMFKAMTAMLLAGPFLTGYTQTINDWYDKEIDAINEPNRPIPSGAISEGEVIAQIWVLLLGGLALSYGLDVWCHHEFPINLALAIFGSFISYIYSAPPLKLKQNGWAGNYALGASYISLPWWCGQAVFGSLDRPVFWIL
jgi:chlorophyll synthase